MLARADQFRDFLFHPVKFSLLTSGEEGKVDQDPRATAGSIGDRSVPLGRRRRTFSEKNEDADDHDTSGKTDQCKEKNSVPKTALQVIAGIPDFSIKPKAWHEELIKTYQQEGEEAFLDREHWHKDWLKFAKTYLTQHLKKAEGAS